MLVVALLSACTGARADSPEGDLADVPRYPQATVSERADGAVAERIYPLAAPRRIGGRLRMDESLALGGELSSVTYRLPDSHDGLEAFTSARKTLLAEGAELLYWCEARDCGSSSLWANEVFGRAWLYGPDNRQAYLLARLESPPRVLALYAITRGNGRAYLHAERLAVDSLPESLVPGAPTLLRQLREQGRLDLLRLGDAQGSAWLDPLTRLFFMDSALRLALSGEAAEPWYQALVEAGVPARRLEVGEPQGAGLRLTLLR